MKIRNYTYQAEENGDGNTSAGSVEFDIAKMNELIAEGVANKFKEEKEAAAKVQPKEESKQATKEEVEDKDFWADVIDPRVNPKLAQLGIVAEAAEDKLDFYTSEDWTEEAEEWLTEDDPVKRKAEKKALRDEIEKAFAANIKNGRNLVRADIFRHVLGDKITKDRTKYQENIGKRKQKQVDSDLAKARRGVDITSGNINGYTPQDIHNMDAAKIEEEFGALQF